MNTQEPMTFWDHLDVLRSSLIKMGVAVVVFAVAAFLMKETLFSVVLAPRSSDFVTYRLLGVDAFSLHLMNTGLTEQFMIHMRTALYAGLLLASPYILYELFRFVSPGLYQNERRYAVWIVGAAYVMFLVGTLVNYFVVFPLTVRFLGTYQVVRRHAAGHEPGDGRGVRTACGLRLAGPHRTDQRPADGRLSSSRHCGHSRRSSHHHANDRCVYALRRVAAHLPAL